MMEYKGYFAKVGFEDDAVFVTIAMKKQSRPIALASKVIFVALIVLSPVF
jgi:hypothetical protein